MPSPSQKACAGGGACGERRKEKGRTEAKGRTKAKGRAEEEGSAEEKGSTEGKSHEAPADLKEACRETAATPRLRS